MTSEISEPEERNDPGQRIVAVFGTFNEFAHPRARVLIEAAEAAGYDVREINRPWRASTGRRLQLVSRPWTGARAISSLLACWLGLVFDAIRFGRRTADAVIVPYLGVLDVHLARLLFDAPILFDHMAPVSGTGGDRSLGRTRLLAGLDRLAVAAADVVIWDTEQTRAAQDDQRSGIVIPVGASTDWFALRHDDAAPGRPVAVCFFGTYTPLQGVPVIAQAIVRLGGRSDIAWTLIGTGQDRDEVEQILDGVDTVRIIEWLDAEELRSEIARADVCLGIFGTTEKAGLVVPNKVYQGAAAGCAIITADSPPQRQALGDAAVYVPPGDADALAAAIVQLAEDRTYLAGLRDLARRRSETLFSPQALSSRVREAVQAGLDRRPSDVVRP